MTYKQWAVHALPSTCTTTSPATIKIPSPVLLAILKLLLFNNQDTQYPITTNTLIKIHLTPLRLNTILPKHYDRVDLLHHGLLIGQRTDQPQDQGARCQRKASALWHLLWYVASKKPFRGSIALVAITEHQANTRLQPLPMARSLQSVPSQRSRSSARAILTPTAEQAD